ncbi:RNA polymerase sigma factor [Halobacillus litoralis]|nr:sigma-70 family RNA polymerase sigma factor [Halobacillus litoralis]
MKHKSDLIEKFMSDNPNFVKQPIVKSFLAQEDNFSLLESHLRGNESSSNLLDEKFKLHFYRAKIVNYLSNLIYYFSIDYDKRVNVYGERFPLVLNKTPNDDEGNNGDNSLIDMVNVDHVDFDSSFEHSLEGSVTDKRLYKAIKKLPKNQKKVLSLHFLKGLSNKEIARVLDESEQNVSNVKRRAFKKLRVQISS